MRERTLFEKMGVTYTLNEEDGCYYPDLLLLPEEEVHIGKCGRTRHRYLKERRRVLFSDLLTSGTDRASCGGR